MSNRRHLFHGGLHTDNGEKHILGKQPSQPANAPEKVYLPVAQHIGAPAKPIVKAGDTVSIGQPVAEAGGFVSAAVHATVSGKVTAVEPILLPSGLQSMAIIIENDFLETRSPQTTLDMNADKTVLLERIRQCGLVGMGGAAFPLHVKLSPPPEKKVDTLLINGAECEPYLASDHRLMLERPQDIACGIGFAMKILGVSRAIVGIEDDKPDAAEAMTKAVRDIGGVEVMLLPVRYPQGSEKHLIQACLKCQVPSGKLPADVGAVVCNVNTCASIAAAIRDGMPMVERLVTVSGGAMAQQKVLRVRIGTLMSELIAQCGGLKSPPVRLLAGGPMMGIALYSDHVPVLKATSAILALTKEEVGDIANHPCIRCGRCVTSCPMKLQPYKMMDLIIAGRYEEAAAIHTLDCIECGSCTFSCPALRPITQSCRIGKREIIALQRNKA